MKYIFEVRAVASQSQSIREKHESLLAGLLGLPPPWGVVNDFPAPDPGGQLSAVVKAGKILGKGLRGEFVYQFRRQFRESAAHDDYLTLTFDPSKVGYKELVSSVFIKYVSVFDAYYAEILDDDFIFMDYDRRRELGVDKRNGIYRIAPVCYLDKRLCEAALGLQPAQIVQKLTGRVEVVRECLNGVFIVITSEILAATQMDGLCEKVKNVLFAPNNGRPEVGK